MTSHKVGRFVCAGSVALLSACGRLAPERQLVRDAAQALGGQAAIEAVAVLTVEGSGTQHNLGQDLRPGLANQTFTVSAYRREFDLVSPAARTTQTRTPNFPYFQGPQAQTQVQGVDDEVAYNAVGDGAATRVSNAVAADRRAERFHHPLTLLRAALAPGAALSAVRAQGAARAVDVTTAAR